MAQVAERKRRHGKLYLLLMALAAAGAAIWVGSSVLSVEEFAFTGARLPAGWDGGRLVVLSDLHGKRFGRQNSRLLEAVRKAGPDVICLCGDMMDEWSGTEYLRPLLEGLVEIAPVYYVTGNHEWASGRMPEMRQLLEETGVTYLSNTFVPLERNGDTITLAGIDDPNGYAGQKSPEEVAGEVKEAAGDGFWLLMAHRNTAGWGRIWCCRATVTEASGVCPLPTACWGRAGSCCPALPTAFTAAPTVTRRRSL